MVTTYETIDIADQCLVDTIPFSAVRLSMNIHQYLTKRSSSPDDAYALALTVGEALIKQKLTSVSRRDLVQIVWKTLSLYQPKAGMRYGIDYDCIEVGR